MAVFVSTLFAGISSAATAAGSAVTAATSALSAAGILTGLQVATTGIAALGTLGAAAQKADALRGEAVDEGLRANQDFIAGQQQANEVRRRLIATVTDQAVAFASNGIDLSSGVVADARKAADDLAEQQIATGQANTGIRAMSRRLRADRLYAQAEQTETGGVFGALASLGDAALKIGRRG